MEKAEAVLGGPLAMGGPRIWGIKERGGGGEMNGNIRRGGVGCPCLWHSPCFGSLELRGGGMVGYKVATLGMMLLAMVLMLARVAKPGQY